MMGDGERAKREWEKKEGKDKVGGSLGREGELNKQERMGEGVREMMKEIKTSVKRERERE